MVQTKAGAAKATKTILSRNPNHFKEIGAKGGRRGNTGGFAKRQLREKVKSL